MKYFFYVSLFSALFFSMYVSYDCYKGTRNERSCKLESVEKEVKAEERLKNTYEELCWVDGKCHIFKTITFLEAIVSGKYLDYLHLYMDLPEKRRLSYDDFIDLHHQMEEFIDLSVFTKLELLDILSYGLILGEIEESDEFKKGAWIYDAESLAEVILLHDSVLPSMKRFSKDKKKFLCLILEGLQFEGFLGNYRNNIAYNISDDVSILKENMEYFDISFLMFICRLAGKYSNGDKNTIRFTSGFYSYLIDFKEDLKDCYF